VQRWIWFLLAAVVGLAADLGTKHWAFDLSGLAYRSEGIRDVMTIIPGWFDFTLALNTGAAFSMFAGRTAFFMMISVVAFLALTYFVHVEQPSSRFKPLMFGLILSGVAGNFWDRVVFEAVRDFIAIHTPDDGFMFVTGRYEWPTFNVADIWISVGAFTMAFVFWREDSVASEQAAEQAKLAEASA
jgi:signal peptidase II